MFTPYNITCLVRGSNIQPDMQNQQIIIISRQRSLVDTEAKFDLVLGHAHKCAFLACVLRSVSNRFKRGTFNVGFYYIYIKKGSMAAILDFTMAAGDTNLKMCLVCIKLNAHNHSAHIKHKLVANMISIV